MAGMNVNELDDKALVASLAEIESSLVKARFAHAMGRLENTASIGGLRKDIARIRTEVRRREQDQGLAKDALIAAHRTRAVAGSGAGEGASGGFLAGVVDKLGDNA